MRINSIVTGVVCLFIAFFVMSVPGNSQCTPPTWRAAVFVSDSNNSSPSHDTLWFGYDTQATYGLDDPLCESELPPPPPAGVFDSRFVNIAGRESWDTPQGLGQGFSQDYRPFVTTAHIDTHKIKFQPGDPGPGYPVTLSWNQAQVLGMCDSAVMIDEVSGGALFKARMHTVNSLSITNAAITTVLIVRYGQPMSGPPSGTVFLTVTPDSITVKDPIKLKFLKPSKRGKGLMPNWANLLSETVVQGGFAPPAVNGSTESDSAGGMVIGVSYMQRLNPLDPLKPKWKPIKDSASFHVWARLTKWDFKKSIGKGFNVLQKTLEDKTGKHTGVARGLDSTGNGLPGDPKRKQLKKQFTKVVPKKHSNKLYAELVALKLNIAASQLGKTPVGFGELVYDVDGSPFDEMSILEISEGADSSMTYWQWYDTAYYNPLYNALYQTNRAFVGKLDTVSFEAGEKLELKGQVDLSAVPFLKQGPIPARRIVPTTAATESEEDFDFEDEEWEEFEDNASTPLAKLYQNFPNPFNPATRLGFRLREESVVTVGIYNVLGEEVARLLEGESLDEGFQSVEFTTRDAPSGVYFYQIRARGGETGDLTILTGKMLLLK